MLSSGGRVLFTVLISSHTFGLRLTEYNTLGLVYELEEVSNEELGVTNAWQSRQSASISAFCLLVTFFFMFVTWYKLPTLLKLFGVAIRIRITIVLSSLSLLSHSFLLLTGSLSTVKRCKSDRHPWSVVETFLQYVSFRSPDS